jgi:hypothetical protein
MFSVLPRNSVALTVRPAKTASARENQGRCGPYFGLLSRLQAWSTSLLR